MLTKEQKEDVLRFLVNRFNFFANARCRYTGEWNYKKGMMVIEADGFDQTAFVQFMKEAVAADGTIGFQTVCDMYMDKMSQDRRDAAAEVAKRE